MKIHTITLNPSVDRILYLDEYVPEVTNRLTKAFDGLGGKGTHVSINLSILGLESQAMGIAYGKNGDKIINMLSKDKIDVCFLKKEGAESRTNYLVIEGNGKCTILAEKGEILDDEKIDEFIEFMDSHISEGDYLVFSGDSSNCVNPNVYNNIMKAFEDRHVKVFMDASGKTLCRCMEEKPFLIKPNLDELSFVCGRELSSEEEMIKAMKELSKDGPQIIALTLGADGAIVLANDKVYRVKSPEVEVKNTIGCGDCFLSGVIYGVYNNLPIESTLKLATAIAAAGACSELSAGFDIELAKNLESKVIVKEL